MRYNKIEANRYRQKNGLLIRYYMNPIFYNLQEMIFSRLRCILLFLYKVIIIKSKKIHNSKEDIMNKNDYAPIAPMGWNSYDYYDTTVNEEQIKKNA